MPIYEFVCKNEKCKCEFEKLVNKDIKTTTCPHCGRRAKKVISAANFEVHGYNAANKYSKESK
jgi:putative FmdB family regulatory protein